MTDHVRTLSRKRPALAQGGLPSFDFDTVGFLSFVIAILLAIDGLIQRKNEQSA